MNDFKLTTPVAFIIFNRADTTIQVFERIRQAKPPQLLVIADGPRDSKIGEKEKCEQTRAIINKVDWNCEVLTNYSDKNLGCKQRVSSGLDWVFNTVDEAIILEDDCLPDMTFFRFCQEMLDQYRNDSRVMIISGDNFHSRHSISESYYFSRYTHIWGWATWARSWKHYDVKMTQWPKLCKNKWLEDVFNNKLERQYWHEIFESVYNNKIDTWDFQLFFASMLQNCLNIMPQKNLITNIGFGVEATHTTDSNSNFSNMPIHALEFPIRHPDHMIRNKYFDDLTAKEQFLKRTIFQRIYGKVKRML